MLRDLMWGCMGPIQELQESAIPQNMEAGDSHTSWG